MAEDIKTLDDLKSAVSGSDAAVVATDAPVRAPQRDELGRSYATGKRKDAVARVWVKPGSGKVIVNGKDINEYFARPVLQMILRQPFDVAGVESRRLPDPRFACGRTEEIRQGQGPPQLPVLEALILGFAMQTKTRPSGRVFRFPRPAGAILRGSDLRWVEFEGESGLHRADTCGS